MSRSYRKQIRFFTCCGDNRPWYKMRRKQRRRILAHQLRNATANYEGEDIESNMKGYDQVFRNEWLEPTDGHYAVTPKMLYSKHRMHQEWYKSDYFVIPIQRYCKPKKRQRWNDDKKQ